MRTNNPLTEDDATFLNRDDDFIALANDYEYGLLDNLLERGISRWTSRNVTLKGGAVYDLSLIDLRVYSPRRSSCSKAVIRTST